jgi:type II secretory pathway pseudopilin PulG
MGRNEEFMKQNKTYRSKRGNEKGTSMVEIAIVLLIFAIVIAFALPVVANSIRSYNLRSAADHLAERISAVRALAMAQNRTVAFAFNNSSGQYGFDFGVDNVPDTTDPDNPGSGGYYLGRLPDGVTASFPDGNPIRISFNSRGELPIGAVAQSIVLQSSGKSAMVNVNLRGRISVQ